MDVVCGETVIAAGSTRSWPLYTVYRVDGVSQVAAEGLICCREFPGEVDKIRTWFRDYKTPDGKPQNKFGFNDKAMNKEFTLGVIKETSEFYQNLLSGKTDANGLALK